MEADRDPPARSAGLTAFESAKALRAGRNWRYESGYLINEFIGRHGHTPAWVVEVEGSTFRLPPRHGFGAHLSSLWRQPRVIRRNRRRLAFAWPLRWPPPDEQARQDLVKIAIKQAGELGGPLPPGCGVCGNTWQGGPTWVRGRARHLCPECAEEIEQGRMETPPGPVTTWLWCIVAGTAGLLLQMLFHWNWGWSVVPLALVAGWLMGSANAPNLERRPVLAGGLTLALVFFFQLTALTLHAASQFAFYGPSELARIFVWTAQSMPANLIIGFAAGSAGLGMAFLEKRLRKI